MAKTAKEIRLMTDAELQQAIRDAKQELFNLRIQKSLGQLEDHSRIPQVKREVARLLTIQRERELAAQMLQEEADAE